MSFPFGYWAIIILDASTENALVIKVNISTQQVVTLFPFTFQDCQRELSRLRREQNQLLGDIREIGESMREKVTPLHFFNPKCHGTDQVFELKYSRNQSSAFTEF